MSDNTNRDRLRNAYIAWSDTSEEAYDIEEWEEIDSVMLAVDAGDERKFERLTAKQGWKYGLGDETPHDAYITLRSRLGHADVPPNYASPGEWIYD
jgi:hypothetical protein